MAYTFKDPISMIPDDLGLVRTAKMVRDTREYNRFDTDNIYAMLNTASVSDGDKWIIEDLHSKIDGNLGNVVSSGSYFGATSAVAESVSLLKNSKGLKLASQSYANFQESKEIEKKIQAQTGSPLNFGEKAWATHSSYYQDDKGKWVENVFQPQVEKEENYNAEMISLIGRINADGGAMQFAKGQVSAGDIRDFMVNSKGISKKKAKRIALSLVDSYIKGSIGDQDLRKLTQLDTNPNTGAEFTEEEALDNISDRLIDIASRQVYWDSSYKEMSQRKGGPNNVTPPGSGVWTPVQGPAISSSLSWKDNEGYSQKKIDALSILNATPTSNPSADLNATTSARTVLNALRQQEVLLVNNYGDDEQVAAYNEMSSAFTGNEGLKDLVHHLTMNTNSFNKTTTGEGARSYSNVRMFVIPQGTEQNMLVKQLFGGDEKGETVSARGMSVSGQGITNEIAIQDLNNSLGTNYTVDDIPELEGLVRNYFKYQVNHGDDIDAIFEQKGTENTAQLTGYSVNTFTDKNGTLADINSMLNQAHLDQFTVDGVKSGTDEHTQLKLDFTNAGKGETGQDFKFKQMTQPGISTGTPTRFTLESPTGGIYNMTENYGIEQYAGGGFTNSVLNTMEAQMPLIRMQERAAKNVQLKIQSGEYQVTGDGSIRSKDYFNEITPILKQDIANIFVNKMQATQGYAPDFNAFTQDETNAYLQYENTQLQRYREKVEKVLVWNAHMQLLKSNSGQVPNDYLNVDNVADLMRILQSDYTYLLTLQNYGLELPSSLIVDVQYNQN